ncbi:response regulator transcription factor [Massilia niastensis]|uniref:response regulator transcription factor n=1 Tax=Massilia niastensis TaxID=544911 RepID=UPI0003729D67|nr:response regulator transcription factor [Massilia niastensis]
MQFQNFPIHIAHADPAMCAGLHAFLAEHGEWRVTLDSRDPGLRSHARVLIADHAGGVELARRHGNRIPVLIVTPLEKEWDVHTAISSGVRGYLLQSCSAQELVKAVRLLLDGECYLSDPIAARVADSLRRSTLTGRQSDVLQLLAEGCCNKQIARRLGIGVGTVKTHVKGVMVKLDAKARTHAVVVAAQRGLITPGRHGAPGTGLGSGMR